MLTTGGFSKRKNISTPYYQVVHFMHRVACNRTRRTAQIESRCLFGADGSVKHTDMADFCTNNSVCASLSQRLAEPAGANGSLIWRIYFGDRVAFAAEGGLTLHRCDSANNNNKKSFSFVNKLL